MRGFELFANHGQRRLIDRIDLPYLGIPLTQVVLPVVVAF